MTMIQHALPWLPGDALEPARFERALSLLVSEWSDHWFVKTRATCRIRLRAVAPAGADQLAWRSGEACAVGLNGAARLALAEAMLERKIAATDVREPDRALLVDLSDRCLDDLIGRLARQMGGRDPAIHPGPVAEAAMVWDIGLGRAGMTLNLAVGRDGLVAWRKAMAPASARRPLQPLSRALAGQPVAIGVRLGQGRLTLADMKELAIGDVVPLDTTTTASLPLTVAGQPIPIRGCLTPEADGAKLAITDKMKVH